MTSRTTVAALAALLVLASVEVRADEPPGARRGQVYSLYERQTIEETLSKLKRTLDPNPEGKIIEGVDVVVLDVFEKRDVLPRFLNVFHVTTRESVVRREVLLHEGDRYNQVIVDETIRNLRQLTQLSLVLAFATVGTAPDRVGLVVVTKDVWSLRSNWDVVASSGGLEELDLQPQERNFLGTHQALSVNFILLPAAYTLGLGYDISRIESSRIALSADANIVVNRATGSPEGSSGDLIAGEPLFSGKTEWAWDATTLWQDVEARRYVNAAVDSYTDPTTGQSVPFEYRARQFETQYNLRRSFGWDVKHDFLFGVGINSVAYRTNFTSGDPKTIADFTTKYVPVSDTRVGPTIQYETYTKRYLRVIDFDSLALQEDYRLGHDVVLAVGPSFHALGSSRNVVHTGASGQYTFALRDGLFRVGFVSVTEAETTRISDAYIEPIAHLVSPTIAGLGRIVVDGTMMYRWRNYLNVQEYLGGGDRLRGYPTNFLLGPDLVSYNVELRTRPVELLTCQLALVGFFDAGEAFQSFSNFEPFQSVGLGIRALFPWLDRTVFRGDFGVPIERHPTGIPVAPFAFLISFGQAFDVPTVAPTPVLSTEQVEVQGTP